MSQGFSRYDRKEKTQLVYCYAGTDVLINKLDIRNARDLRSFEADITMQRQYELEHENLVQGRFSASHLKNIHKYIFQVYTSLQVNIELKIYGRMKRSSVKASTFKKTSRVYWQN